MGGSLAGGATEHGVQPHGRGDNTMVAGEAKKKASRPTPSS